MPFCGKVRGNVFVADAGSTDGTPELAMTFAPSSTWK
jgi:hypothetical protein